jgi:hypothetical protein
MSGNSHPLTALPIGANDPALIETVLFWAGSGVTPRVVMASLNIDWDGREPDWLDVRLAISSKSRGWYATRSPRAA